MNADRFDAWTLALLVPKTRRSLLRAAAATTLATALGHRVSIAAPLPCTLKKTGRRCKKASQCCSGVCTKIQGRKKCRSAPNQGVCSVQQNICGDPADQVQCGLTNNACTCAVTIDNTSLCAEGAGTPCFNCSSNEDCENRSGGTPGEVCVTCGGCIVSNSRGCRAPCPNPAA
jgi:hypothetical protein